MSSDAPTPTLPQHPPRTNHHVARHPHPGDPSHRQTAQYRTTATTTSRSSEHRKEGSRNGAVPRCTCSAQRRRGPRAAMYTQCPVHLCYRAAPCRLSLAQDDARAAGRRHAETLWGPPGSHSLTAAPVTSGPVRTDGHTHHPISPAPRPGVFLSQDYVNALRSTPPRSTDRPCARRRRRPTRPQARSSPQPSPLRRGLRTRAVGSFPGCWVRTVPGTPGTSLGEPPSTCVHPGRPGPDPTARGRGP